MNRSLAFTAALVAGMTSAAGMAQTAASPATAAPAPHPATVQVVPAKIALIEFEQVAAATNEGQRDLIEVQKKYEPKKQQLSALSQEVDSLKKQMQNAPATLSDADRASKLRTIDTKEKQLQRDGEDAQNSYNEDMQKAIGEVAKKLGPVVVKYVQDNGYTMLLNNSGQQGGLSVLWLQPGTTDISQAIVQAYNASSGVSAPMPSAPAPTAAHPHAGATAPKQ